MLKSFQKNKKGIVLMIIAAVFAAFGQLAWKLSASQGLHFAVLGLGLYGIGALLMIIAYRFGSVSVLQPMLSANYVLSILLGYYVLGEAVSITKVLGILVIIAGVVLIAGGDN